MIMIRISLHIFLAKIHPNKSYFLDYLTKGSNMNNFFENSIFSSLVIQGILKIYRIRKIIDII